MRREARSHWKVVQLKARLGVDLATARGIVEGLWDGADDHWPTGDVGAFPADFVARDVIGFGGDENALIGALEAVELLDRLPDGRLVIHDWAEWAPDYVHMRLARKNMKFADGTMPRSTRLSKRERKGNARRAHSVRTESAQRAHRASAGAGSGSGSDPGSEEKENPSLRSGQKKAPRGWKTVPEGEELTPERRELAERAGLRGEAVDREWRRFTNHDFATAKRRVTPTWSNWCDKAVEQRPKSAEEVLEERRKAGVRWLERQPAVGMKL